jgi:hypothetical protein
MYAQTPTPLAAKRTAAGANAVPCAAVNNNNPSPACLPAYELYGAQKLLPASIEAK